MCPPAGQLDEAKFNVVEFINRMFPTEQVSADCGCAHHDLMSHLCSTISCDGCNTVSVCMCVCAVVLVSVQCYVQHAQVWLPVLNK